MALGPGGNRVVEVRIGAALDSGFRRSFGSAADSARQFGTAVKALAGSFDKTVQPTKRQTEALARAEAAAAKAAAKVKALDAALATPPASAKRAQELARAEAAATAAKTRVDALNSAMATPPAPSTKQVEQLGRLREQAGAATERVRALEATLAKGGHWGAGAAKLRGELERARDRPRRLKPRRATSARPCPRRVRRPRPRRAALPVPRRRPRAWRGALGICARR
jgi:ABC-type transporter Mla subunit MlaD